MANQSKNKMNLEKLTKIRDKDKPAKLPIPEEELCERMGKLFTGAVNDVLREMCILNVALPSEIMPLKDEMVICGPALTIKSSKNPMIEGELETRAQMLDEIYEGCICVWETGGDTDSAHWGEVMTKISKSKGAVGAVIDGGLRDTKKVLPQNFPVFYKYKTSNGSLSRCKIIDYLKPVLIGDVIIYPGDIIFGDIDGVVVVPREVAYDVLLRAEEIEESEQEILEWIDDSMSAVDIVSNGGYF